MSQFNIDEFYWFLWNIMNFSLFSFKNLVSLKLQLIISQVSQFFLPMASIDDSTQSSIESHQGLKTNSAFGLLSTCCCMLLLNIIILFSAFLKYWHVSQIYNLFCILSPMISRLILINCISKWSKIVKQQLSCVSLTEDGSGLPVG